MAMRREWVPLVEIRHERGVAGVCRSIEDGDLLLTRDLEKLSGAPIEGFGPASTDDLAGGLLPPGAVSAEAIDKRGIAHSAVCARGAWIAALPDPSRVNGVPARFRDTDGAIVRRPLRQGATVTLLQADVRRPCPAVEDATGRSRAGPGSRMSSSARRSTTSPQAFAFAAATARTSGGPGSGRSRPNHAQA